MSAPPTPRTRPQPPGAGTGAPRSLWRSVGLPAEHGGWGLTLEPVLAGLLIAPSWAGLALGLAAFGVFLARTPLKLAVVDFSRGRWLTRSTFAALLAAAELIVVGLLVAFASSRSGNWWATALAVAAPFVAVEFAYDVRSRSRRLAPEICGALGIAGASTAIILAAGRPWALGGAVWLLLAARIVGSIPAVRAQIFRLHGRAWRSRPVWLAHALGLALAAGGALLRPALLGALGVVVGGTWWHRRALHATPRAAKAVGMAELRYGLAVVVAAACGCWIAA